MKQEVVPINATISSRALGRPDRFSADRRWQPHQSAAAWWPWESALSSYVENSSQHLGDPIASGGASPWSAASTAPGAISGFFQDTTGAFSLACSPILTSGAKSASRTVGSSTHHGWC